MQIPTLRLNPKADFRLRQGHLWIYSNEIDNKVTPLANLQAGQQVIIESAAGKVLGLAYANPHTLICARMLRTNDIAPITIEFFQQRIARALALRQQIFSSECYRLVYGESDWLPGLVIDRFYDVLVVQISTAGMEQFLDLIVTALDQLLDPRVILVKNDGKMRAVEGLPNYIAWQKGGPLLTAPLEENGVKFLAPLVDGQKTGWFYDHRLNRARLRAYVHDKRVLDLFAYIGGWGIQAAAFGAKAVVCSDISDFALEQVQVNAQLNNLANVSTLQGDAFDCMQAMLDAGEKFDVVILDPPAFIPRRKDLPKGLAAYQKANLQALRLLTTGGILFSGSCSMHLPASDLQAAMQQAALKLGRQLQILEQGHQGPDHPIHPAIPETAYLKAFIGRVY